MNTPAATVSRQCCHLFLPSRRRCPCSPVPHGAIAHARAARDPKTARSPFEMQPTKHELNIYTSCGPGDACTSEPVLSEWMITSLPRSRRSKVEIPKEMASSSNPMIWLSPLDLKRDITCCGGITWVQWISSSMKTTTPKCGLPPAASENICTCSQ